MIVYNLLLVLPFWGLIPQVNPPGYSYKYRDAGEIHTLLTYDQSACWNVFNARDELVYKECADGRKEKGPAFISHDDLRKKLRGYRDSWLRWHSTLTA